MNQRYLLLTSLLVAGTCFAQSGRPLVYTMQHDGGTIQQAPPVVDEMRDGGDVLFSEDFANGLAGNNSFGAWTVSGPNGNIWKRTTAGPNGAFTVPAQMMTQPAPANGYMLFASDSANCSCSSGEANWPASPTNWEAALESPLLDLSATPYVKLEWRQRVRWCCQPGSPYAVEVSTDGGATWPITMDAAAGISGNNDPGTQTRSLMLSNAIVPDPAQVKFRFKHNPLAFAYFWQIDDVKIIELYADDLRMNDGVFSHTGNGEEYGRVPSAQLNPEMLVGGSVTNWGGLDQTNVTVTMDVTGPVPFNSVISAGDILREETVNAQQDFTLPALTDGIYEGTFTVAADATDMNDTDNQFLRNFEVVENRYSLDGIGIHPTANQILTTVGTTSFPDATDGLVLMNYYEVRTEVVVYGLEIALGNNTLAGGYVMGALRDTTPVFATPPVMNQVIDETEPTDITTTHVAAGRINLCFNQPVTLVPNPYIASVSLFSTTPDGVRRITVLDDLTVPQPGFASSVSIPNDDVYSNGNAFAIRMITNNPSGTVCAVGINDRDGLQGVSMYPNVSNDGIVTIATTVPGMYSVEMFDMLGQSIYSTSINGTTQLNLGGHADGVYMVRISNASGSSLQRLTLN